MHAAFHKLGFQFNANGISPHGSGSRNIWGKRFQFLFVCFEINNFDSSGLTSRKGVHIVNFFSIICQSF